MSNFDTVVLDGEMGLFTKVREGDLPYYTGATEVTPSDSTQVLETADTIVTENITINPIPDMDLEEVQVTYTPDEEGQTDTITPSTGYVGIAEVEVTVEPIDSDYVGSGIARKDSDDLTASGASVIAPAGYYEEAATKSVASGSAATPATTITANPTISVGNDGSITASVSATQSVTPTVSAGYVSSGTAGTITVSGSGSAQLSTQAGTTITPTTSQQTAVAAGKFTTGNVIVDPMPSGTAGTPTATKGTVSNHSVSVTPSVTNQTGYITGGTKTGTAVTVSASELVSGNKAITANGTGIDVTEYATVSVAVPGDTPTLQTKSVSYTPTESQQTAVVTPDTGYDGLDQVNVTVGAIDSEYVGSAIDRRDSTDLSASGATVTAPAGYYAAAASKAVASGSAATPATTITANPSISVDSSGLITATASASQSVTPTVSAGYVSSGTSGTVTVSGSATEQLTTQAAQTIHPSTTDQTITSGKYLTGAQTIKAVTTTNLTAANIVSGVTVEIGDADDSDCVASVTGTASGGGEVAPNDVNFYDYDGTLLYSYSAADFANLSALPANPTHTGLTAQGWNWSLSDAKTYVATYGILDIGQTYDTTDGKTRIYISIPDTATQSSRTVKIQLTCYTANVAVIEWGDGNSSTHEGTGTEQHNHEYTIAGDYVIAISCSATVTIGSTNNKQLIKYTDADAYMRHIIKKIEIGTNISLGIYAFAYCDSLESITLPSYITAIENYTFYQNGNLKALIIPKNCSSYGSNSPTGRDNYSLVTKVISFPSGLAFANAASLSYMPQLERLTLPSLNSNLTLNYNINLKKVIIPNGTTSIKDDFLRACRCIERVIIPNTVTTIGTRFMRDANGAPKEIVMLPTTPPSLGTQAFMSAYNFTIYVPNGKLSDYQSETNWSSFASNMVEMPA